jgi:phosphoglycolate phosphatase-like HAD superfamily hydrolase
MKPILAIDFNGALLKPRPFLEAHKNWFQTMANLLEDDSVNEYSGLDNYFGKVHEVMKRYLGDVPKETRTAFARNLFSMSTIAEVTTDDLVADFATYLRGVKDKYTLALITSAPASSVDPILSKIGCSDLFDIIYKSPMDKHPNKKELFSELVRDHGKPAYYIGHGDKDIATCTKLGIPSISVNWVSTGTQKGNYDVQNISELQKILQ